MEAVENLVVGEHTYAAFVVDKAFVQGAFDSLKFDFVASVGENFAQTVELLFVVGENE